MFRILQELSSKRENRQNPEETQLLLNPLLFKPPHRPEPIEHQQEVIESPDDFRKYIIQHEDINLNCLAHLSHNKQSLILSDLFNDLTHPLIQKILLLKGCPASGFYSGYALISELMARQQMIEELRKTDVVFRLPNMRHLKLSPQQKQLFKKIILSKEPLPEESIETADSQSVNFFEIIDYLMCMPFPINILILSEALRPNTRLIHFLEKGLLIPTMDRLVLHTRLGQALDTCHAEARQNNSWTNLMLMAPEIKVIATRLIQENRLSLDYEQGYSRQHLLNISRLLTEPALSDENRKWAQESGAKKALLDFIDAIPDEQRQQYYRELTKQNTPLAEFLNTHVETGLDYANRLMTWISPSSRVLPPIEGKVDKAACSFV